MTAKRTVAINYKDGGKGESITGADDGIIGYR